MTANEITNKMSEQTQVNTANVEVSLQATTEDPKKVEQRKRLAEWGHKNREKLAQEAKAKESEPKPSQVYNIGTVIAVVVLDLLGYYIYESKKGDNSDIKVTLVRSVETQKRTNKFEME